jgi:hypothetical protein
MCLSLTDLTRPVFVGDSVPLADWDRPVVL